MELDGKTIIGTGGAGGLGASVVASATTGIPVAIASHTARPRLV